MNPYLYLTARGLRRETIDEMQCVSIGTPGNERSDALYSEYLHESRNDRKGEPRKMLWGLLIPYYHVSKEYGTFGRARVLEPAPAYAQWCEDQNQDVPKFISPAARNLRGKPGAHLYFLKHDIERIGKSKDIYCFVEGEVKAAAVSQDIRTLDSEQDSHITIGGGGVSMFLCTPELSRLNFRQRRVLIFFDIDGIGKLEVMQQEIQLATYCLVHGARSVRSVWWEPDKGKGIDDYLDKIDRDRKASALRRLKKKAVSPYIKYANPPIKGAQGYSIDAICREIAKTDGLQGFQVSGIVADLERAYTDKGVSRREIRQELETAIDTRQRLARRKRLTSEAGSLQETLHIEFTPWIPEGFAQTNGHLTFNDLPLCRMFAVGKYISTDGPGESDSYVLNFRDKTLLLPSEVHSQYKHLAQLFNRNQEILYDSTAKLIQQYISRFWLSNSQNIPVVPYFQNTGWHKDGFFQLPMIARDKCQAEFDFLLEKKFTPKGDKAAQYEFFEEVMTTHRGAIFAILAFATPLLSVLGLPRYIVNIYGSPGSGKSLGCMLAMSIYGDPALLTHNMDSTKVGQELTFSLYKDLPVLLDEINTASANARKIAEVVTQTIYGFYQGRGRTRASIKVNLREVHEFMGLVFLTSERSLDSILSVNEGMNVGGAYRRTLEFPVLDPDELWAYHAHEESQFFARLHKTMHAHFGHVGHDWLLYLEDVDVRARIVKQFDDEMRFVADEGWNLRGTEKLIALCSVMFDEVETFLKLKEGSIRTLLESYLQTVVVRQQRQIDAQIADMSERFINSLETFLAQNRTCFKGLCPEDAILNKVFGEVESLSQYTHVYLRADAFRVLCNDFGFEKDVLLPKLKEQALFRPRTRVKKGTKDTLTEDSWQKKIAGVNGKVYHFLLPVMEEDE